MCACCTGAGGDRLVEEADEFLHPLLNTFCLCASAESLSCLISPPPTIALPCFIPGLCAPCTYIYIYIYTSNCPQLCILPRNEKAKRYGWLYE